MLPFQISDVKIKFKFKLAGDEKRAKEIGDGRWYGGHRITQVINLLYSLYINNNQTKNPIYIYTPSCRKHPDKSF